LEGERGGNWRPLRRAARPPPARGGRGTAGAPNPALRRPHLTNTSTRGAPSHLDVKDLAALRGRRRRAQPRGRTGRARGRQGGARGGAQQHGRHVVERGRERRGREWRGGRRRGGHPHPLSRPALSTPSFPDVDPHAGRSRDPGPAQHLARAVTRRGARGGAPPPPPLCARVSACACTRACAPRARPRPRRSRPRSLNGWARRRWRTWTESFPSPARRRPSRVRATVSPSSARRRTGRCRRARRCCFGRSEAAGGRPRLVWRGGAARAPTPRSSLPSPLPS